MASSVAVSLNGLTSFFTPLIGSLGATLGLGCIAQRVNETAREIHLDEKEGSCEGFLLKNLDIISSNAGLALIEFCSSNTITRVGSLAGVILVDTSSGIEKAGVPRPDILYVGLFSGAGVSVFFGPLIGFVPAALLASVTSRVASETYDLAISYIK